MSAVRARSPDDVGTAAIARLERLCDPGTLSLLDATDENRPAGLVAATGAVDGRHIVCYAGDASFAGGSVGVAEADAVVRALRLAGQRRWPVVAFLESAGARLQEGPAALRGFGEIFFENVALSGRVAQISVITGTSAGGGCYSPALTDFVVMTRSSSMFLTGPRVVHEALGEEVTASALGGADVHARNGVCHLVADDLAEAAQAVRDLLGHMPGSGPAAPAVSPPDGDPGRHLPPESRQVYDVRAVVRDVVDDGRFLELCERWARNVVTGLARVGAHPVGVVANQPRYIGGVIDAEAAEKAARFVATADALGLPLLVFVDTPGFMPGRRQEAAGIIRHGAQLVRAFAAATVPRFTVVLRKAYGGAYITMNAKALGADLALAWTGAEIGVMGADAAVRILHRRDLATADRSRLEALAADYAGRQIDAQRALELGVVDAVIAPSETRSRLLAALRANG